MPRGTRFTRHFSFVEVGLGLLLLGALTLLFAPFYSYGALALVAIVAVREGVREGLAEKWELEQRLAETRSAGSDP